MSEIWVQWYTEKGTLFICSSAIQFILGKLCKKCCYQKTVWWEDLANNLRCLCRHWHTQDQPQDRYSTNPNEMRKTRGCTSMQLQPRDIIQTYVLQSARCSRFYECCTNTSVLKLDQCLSWKYYKHLCIASCQSKPVLPPMALFVHKVTSLQLSCFLMTFLLFFDYSIHKYHIINTLTATMVRDSERKC